ncbi:glycosyltransferase family 2 protein [Butyrivibrio proteoclasticus]|uniref:glycosyltransferase family 2 protein n=1 Tax=Butyrivibrio proteoclasticus TaxID=43305 RepID=UPI00047EBA1C|nr:glycosyltransferase family 2 protein [Butyrivibrio proteoclasticus]
MKLLSIAIPCYNSEAYMSKCIDSLLVGGEEVEILIVDDGSKDRTAEIADEYAKKYPTIVKAIHKPNGGHGSAVNTGIENATGLFFKVVDSDDWVKEIAYRKILATLSELAGGDTQLDLLISNFVYNKVGEKRHKVMRYNRMFPVEKLFTWEDVMRTPKGHYLLMHSAIYRTKLLRECGLKLPEHTFYVDNIYVFNPLPFVKNMYYLDVNFYYYYIGREDQSVNQQIMLSRIDQQIRVNKLMVDYYVENIGMIKSQCNRHKYMFNYLEIITAISSILLITEDTKENLAKRKELLDYIKDKSFLLYLKIRYSIEGTYIYLPGKGGRKITLAGYKLLRNIFHFN